MLQDEIEPSKLVVIRLATVWVSHERSRVGSFPEQYIDIICKVGQSTSNSYLDGATQTTDSDASETPKVSSKVTKGHSLYRKSGAN